MKISLIASSVRCWLWDEFFSSLDYNPINWECIFSGDLTPFQVRPYLKKYPNFRYIHTGKIKPAQCYEISRRAATGELIHWTCDDAEYEPNALRNVCNFWESLDNSKAVVSIKTNENNSNNLLDNFRLIGNNQCSSLMAPLAVMSREYLNKLGGFDRRFIGGQYENFAVKMVLADGGKVYKYEGTCIHINHLEKHGSGTKFWNNFDHDRKILEDAWVKGGYAKPPRPLAMVAPGGKPYHYYPVDNREELYESQTGFEPYEDTDILNKSQSFKGDWE